MTQFVVLSKTNPHLPHDSVELQSPPPPDALNDELAQINADLYIGQLLHGESRAPAGKPTERGREPRLEGAIPSPDTGPAPKQAPQPKGVHALPPLEPLDEESRLRAAFAAVEDYEVEQPRAGLFSRLRARHVTTALLVLVAFFWPIRLGAAFLVLGLLAVLVIQLLRHLVAAGHWHRFARKHPERAERLRRLADSAAERLDAVLDFLPDGLADSLALPDMSQPVAHRPSPTARRPAAQGACAPPDPARSGAAKGHTRPVSGRCPFWGLEFARGWAYVRPQRPLSYRHDRTWQ